MPLFALLGSFVGSFLNVCIDRLPQGQSIINPPSHCPACNHKLGSGDLVPLFSYLWLRRRCRYCGAPIPVRLPVVEGVTALLFAFLYWKFGLGLELGILLIYACLLIIIFVIDLEHQLVLNKVTYPAMLLALALSFFWPGIKEVSGLGGATISRTVGSLAGEAVAQATISLAGGLLGLVVMSIPVIAYPSGMGWGDVKLAALVGLMTGYPLVIVALLLSVISGGLVAASLLAFKIKQRQDPVPFAPFLATAAMVSLLWGQAIWQWYL
ncbi:MAG: prepilin peptidase [Chloroflexi bacterium]|nr:prepilin peptidase [Chloroflexota bacterium]